MIVYRLCKKEYRYDLSGHGAEMNSGRWNGKGNAALYTAGSRALAVLEVADELSITKLQIPDLPKNWNRNPPARSTQYLGDDFLKENKYLILQVPSATVTGDYNYIISPAHPDFTSVKVIMTEPFEFDSRLFQKH